jgi:ABC-type multidrug transport system fused ATPase/permease subunit
MDSCENCNAPTNGNYCSNCGQPTVLKRIDKHYIFQEIGEILGAKKGLLFTIKKLLISPGKSVRHFLAKDRYRFVKPIIFLIVMSLIYTFVNYFSQIKIDEYTFSSPFLNIRVDEVEGVESVFKWMRENFGYSNLLIGLFMAFWVKLLFRKSGYNLFEIFILMCFVSGVSIIFLSVGTIIQSITHWNAIENTNYLAMIYLVWAVGQFFDKKRITSYAKTLLAYFLGAITFSAFVLSIGFLIDIVMNK